MGDSYSDYCEIRREKEELHRKAQLDENKKKLNDEKEIVLKNIHRLVNIELSKVLHHIQCANYGLAKDNLKEIQHKIIQKLYSIGIG